MLDKSGDYVPTYNESIVEKIEKKSVGAEVKDSILTGISFIIPVIIAGGMIGAFAVMAT